MGGEAGEVVARESEARVRLSHTSQTQREQAAEPRRSAQRLLNPRCGDKIEKEGREWVATSEKWGDGGRSP